jgi:hypothetical protein
VLTIGAGDGRAALRGHAPTDRRGRLRRVQVVTDKSLRSQLKVNRRAAEEVALRQSKQSIEEIIVTDSNLAPFGSWNDGDDILVSLDSDWGDLEVWVRVLATTYTPETNQASLSVRRTDMISA